MKLNTIYQSSPQQELEPQEVAPVLQTLERLGAPEQVQMSTILIAVTLVLPLPLMFMNGVKLDLFTALYLVGSLGLFGISVDYLHQMIVKIKALEARVGSAPPQPRSSSDGWTPVRQTPARSTPVHSTPGRPTPARPRTDLHTRVYHTGLNDIRRSRSAVR